MFQCFNFSTDIRFLIRALLEKNANISNKLNFSDVYRSVNYTGSLAKFKVGVNSLCMQPNVVYTSINNRKLKFIE